MAITWGNIITGSKSTRKGKIGIEATINSSKSTNTTTYVTVNVYFASMYSLTDVNNTYYYDAGKTSATTSKGSVSIDHDVNSGGGWSSSNQTKIGSYEHSYTRTSSAQTKYFAAKITGIDNFGSSNVSSVYTSVSIPALTSYTISYNANGGSGAPGNQTKVYGVALTLTTAKPTTAKAGHTFSKWNTNASGTGTSYASGANYTANANATLYAQWTANTYTISYDANGGSGAPASQTKTHGVALTLSSTKPTRTNYTFKGWATTSTATTATYASGASFTGNANTKLYAVWDISYVKPKITNFTVARCDSTGTVSDTGTYALVKFDWSCETEVSSVKIEWKLNTDSSYASNTTVTSSGTSGTVSRIVGAGSLNTDYAYNIRVTVADQNGDNDDTRNINPMVLPIDFLKGGTGVAIGKPASQSNKFDVAWDTQLNGNLSILGNVTSDIITNGDIYFNDIKAIYGKDADGNYKVAMIPCTQSGNTAVGYGNYSNKSGNTNIYGYDVLHYVSSTASGTLNYRPYIRTGDTVTLNGIRLAGYVTNASTEVWFTVPFARPIIGSPTCTAASVNGFVLRQNGAYTHGSSASTDTKPASYVAYVTYNNGVMIRATFTNTTNVVNNAPIGIVWSGTLTFS